MGLTLRGLYARAVGSVVPERVRTRNGVVVPATSLFDRDDPDYRAGLVDPLRSLVRPDDEVVVVGEDCCVASVVAARAAAEGHVSVFTAVRECAERCRSAHELNGTHRTVDVEHAVVGTTGRTRGDGTTATAADAREVDVTDLPPCDVLVLDCEGGETTLVWALEQVPRVVVVEVHGHLGADLPLIEAVLDDREYALERRTDAGVHPEHVVLVGVQDVSRWRGPFDPGWN